MDLWLTNTQATASAHVKAWMETHTDWLLECCLKLPVLGNVCVVPLRVVVTPHMPLQKLRCFHHRLAFFSKSKGYSSTLLIQWNVRSCKPQLHYMCTFHTLMSGKGGLVGEIASKPETAVQAWVSTFVTEKHSTFFKEIRGNFPAILVATDADKPKHALSFLFCA